jgi:hypothetical protein
MIRSIRELESVVTHVGHATVFNKLFNNNKLNEASDEHFLVKG